MKDLGVEESESLSLQKPGRSRKTSLAILGSDPMLAGAEGKEKLRLRIGKKELSLIKRQVESPKMVPEILGFGEDVYRGKSPAEQYAIALKMLQDRNLPVVSTVRIVSENEVAVTDVVAKGGVVYDAKEDNLKIMSPETYGERQPTELDPIFCRLDFERVRQEGEEIAKRASTSGVGLPQDGPLHLVLRPDGSWDLMILDIAFVKIWKSQVVADEMLSGENWDLSSLNRGAVSIFVHGLQSLARRLEKQ